MPQESNRTPSTSSGNVLPERIERLFEVHRPPQAPERRWRNNEVVAACRSNGRDFSESHLSELRRGVKQNPTMRTLDALAWFFDVRVGYFTDSAVAADVERELADREEKLRAKLAADQEAQEDAVAAARELQQAMRTSRVTKMAHRGAGAADHRQQAAMMRALARALVADDDPDALDVDDD